MVVYLPVYPGLPEVPGSPWVQQVQQVLHLLGHQDLLGDLPLPCHHRLPYLHGYLEGQDFPEQTKYKDLSYWLDCAYLTFELHKLRP